MDHKLIHIRKENGDRIVVLFQTEKLFSGGHTIMIEISIDKKNLEKKLQFWTEYLAKTNQQKKRIPPPPIYKAVFCFL